MSRQQLIRFIYKQNQASLKLFDAKSKTYAYIPIKGQLQLHKYREKYCIGSYDLARRQPSPCKDWIDLTHSQYLRCRDCEVWTGFTECVKCNGMTCKSQAAQAIEYCNRDHAVYLAYFPGGLVKVGTAMWQRRQERILEQGAVAALFLCRTNGKIAREIEYQIGLTGIKTRVTSDYKLKNHWIDESEEEIHHRLQGALSLVQTAVLQPYTAYQISPVFFSQYYRFDQLRDVLKGAKGQLAMDFLGQGCTSQEYQYVKEFDEVVGEVVTCIGSICVLQKPEGIVAYDFSKLSGYLIQLDGSGKSEYRQQNRSYSCAAEFKGTIF